MIGRSLAATLLAVCMTTPAVAGSDGGPLHLVRWSGESVRLQPGETATLQVSFDQMPLRRWTLLVESSGERVCHLNVVRDRDGSLLYDVRDESRHEVDVPWGTGESLTAIVTAGRRGFCAVGSRLHEIRINADTCGRLFGEVGDVESME